MSIQETQLLYARILAGEVERPGSTSIKTLSILRDLDQPTAKLFRMFCSASVFVFIDEGQMLRGIVISLGGDANQNALRKFGLSFNKLNVLSEHGLIRYDYETWLDIRTCVSTFGVNEKQEEVFVLVPFRFQDRYWILEPSRPRKADAEYRVYGVALTKAGLELARVVECQSFPGYRQELEVFFTSQGMVMTEVDSGLPRLIDTDLS